MAQEKKVLIPTQVYRPKDFVGEIEKIRQSTKDVFSPYDVLVDKDGNCYRIDYCVGKIQVN